ncbi:MAG: hypothetical protein HY010_14130 [Acidobacteria bacterium]|nr:hypothetical protein [Acidobacteriota bacterium]
MSTPEPQSSRWQSQFDLSENLTCVLDEMFRVVYCNRAWDIAAKANGVEQATGDRLRGQALLLYVPRALEYHYSKVLEKAREKHIVVFTDYECNTPNVYRKYRMKIAPVPETPLLALVHTVLIEGSIPYRVHSAIDYDYGSGDVVTMCAQCRRTKLLHANVWDWVPEFVQRAPPRVTHGICDDCIALYCRTSEPS